MRYFLAILILLCAAPAWDETYYLYPSGAGTFAESALGAGCSLGTASCSMSADTFEAAFESAHFTDNDIISVYQGTYDMTGLAGTTTADNLSLQGQGDNTVWQNGGTMTFAESFTIDDMKFDAWTAAVFTLDIDEAGEDGSGTAVRDCYFTNENGMNRVVTMAAGSNQAINGFTFTDNTVGDISDNGDIFCLRLHLGTLSNFTITGNTLGDFTSATGSAMGFMLGDAAVDVTTANVSNNTFGSFAGANGSETHYILAYGTAFTIDSNKGTGMNAGTAHEPIYLKGDTSSISYNTLTDCNSEDGNITLKDGANSTNNTIAGNIIDTTNNTIGIQLQGTGSCYDNYIVVGDGIGIHSTGYNSQAYDIYNNYVKTNDATTIYLNNNDGGKVYNNILVGNPTASGDEGLKQDGANCSNMEYYNNVVYGFNWGLDLDTDATLYNNIFWGANQYDVVIEATFAGTWDYNNYSTYNNDPGGSNDITDDPKLSGDQLPLNPALWNAGTDLTGTFIDDYYGIKRDATPSIGAVEMGHMRLEHRR